MEKKDNNDHNSTKNNLERWSQLVFLCDRNLAMMVITVIEVSFTHSSGDSNMQIQIKLVYVWTLDKNDINMCRSVNFSPQIWK
jgi:hypothetical protein